MYDNVCLIIQGPAMNKNELEKDVNEYLKVVKNIVISSYSKCITENVRNKCIIIDNDSDMCGNNKIVSESPLGYVINKKKIRNNYEFALSYNDNEKIETKYDNKILPCVIDNHPNIFQQIVTTRRGIKLANIKFPDVKYYIIIRADMFIIDFDQKLYKWINMIDNNIKSEKDLFDSRIILKYTIKLKPWYFIDCFYAGLKQDINRYFSFNKYNNIADTSHECLTSSYLIENDQTITDEIAEEKYFMFDTFDIYWHKSFHAKDQHCYPEIY